jgi:hypothetical protein
MVPPMKRIFPIAMLSAGLLISCAAKIGDDCELDVDCSPSMERNCDNSQPNGYCLIIGCGPDECPKEASCVEFTTPCPVGEGYEAEAEWDKCGLIEPNRGRTYCLKRCHSNKGCRPSYECVEVKDLSAAVIDFEGNYTEICVPRTDD